MPNPKLALREGTLVDALTALHDNPKASLYCLLHTHNHGSDSRLFVCREAELPPAEDDALIAFADQFGLVYEPEQGEQVDISSVHRFFVP